MRLKRKTLTMTWRGSECEDFTRRSLGRAETLTPPLLSMLVSGVVFSSLCKIRCCSSSECTFIVVHNVCASEHMLVSGGQGAPVIEQDVYSDPQEVQGWVIGLLDNLLDQVDIDLDQAHESLHESAEQEQVCLPASVLALVPNSPIFA